MAVHALTDHFRYFFRRINPSGTFEQQAAREHKSITALIEDPSGPAGLIAPQCFLQGSYKQDTAIYTINDVDIVALCRLWYPASGGGGQGWSRDQIFQAIAAAIARDPRYASKIRYTAQSMCVKVDLGIKVEVLPVVFKAGNSDPAVEPFMLYRPPKQVWGDGYARYHQYHITQKNKATGGNFVPTIKMVKHLRSHFNLAGVSFHIECLLWNLSSSTYSGGIADCIASVLGVIAQYPADRWYGKVIKTPCGDRDIFTGAEWDAASWVRFHQALVTWARAAALAVATPDRAIAIEAWQVILGEDYFPTHVSP